MSAMQTFTGSSGTPPVPQFSTALSGTNQVSANIQIFEKSSTYFVATTHLMYYLELAEKALNNSDTAGAKNHFDSSTGPGTWVYDGDYELEQDAELLELGAVVDTNCGKINLTESFWVYDRGVFYVEQ